MGRLIITQNVTLDGRAEMLDDWFDPADQDPEMDAEVARQAADEEVLLLGRRTFVDFRGYWPDHRDDDPSGTAALLDRVHKVVVSSTLTDPQWVNTTVRAGDPVVIARELRASAAGDVVVTGSLRLAHALIGGGLVDEYRLFTYPAWQGRGRGFFPEGFATTDLRPVDVKAFASGIVYAAFQPR